VLVLSTTMPREKQQRQLISPTEAASLLGVHVGSIYRLIGQGRLTKYERGIGGHRTFLDRKEVEALGRVAPQPKP
jgi:excisionase family DNA binding protein